MPKNQATLIYRIINTDAPDVTSLNPSLPGGLNAILRKALERIYTAVTGMVPVRQGSAAVRYQILEDDADRSGQPALRDTENSTSSSTSRTRRTLGILHRRLARLLRDGRSFAKVRPAACLAFSSGLCGDLHRRPHAVPSGKGEVIGEVAYLHPTSDDRSASVTLENSLSRNQCPALGLASE